MTFQPEKVKEFLALFNESKDLIRNFEGVELLELYQDKKEENIFFTYSIWKDHHHLENYRRSDLFEGVWTKTRVLFQEKAEAWSLDKRISL